MGNIVVTPFELLKDQAPRTPENPLGLPPLELTRPNPGNILKGGEPLTGIPFAAPSSTTTGAAPGPGQQSSYPALLKELGRRLSEVNPVFATPQNLDPTKVEKDISIPEGILSNTEMLLKSSKGASNTDVPYVQKLPGNKSILGISKNSKGDIAIGIIDQDNPSAGYSASLEIKANQSKGTFTVFGDKNFKLKDLEEILKEEVQRTTPPPHPKTLKAGS